MNDIPWLLLDITSHQKCSETYGDEFEIDDIEWSTQLELSMDDLSPNNQKEI